MFRWKRFSAYSFCCCGADSKSVGSGWRGISGRRPRRGPAGLAARRGKERVKRRAVRARRAAAAARRGVDARGLPKLTTRTYPWPHHISTISHNPKLYLAPPTPPDTFRERWLHRKNKNDSSTLRHAYGTHRVGSYERRCGNKRTITVRGVSTSLWHTLSHDF